MEESKKKSLDLALKQIDKAFGKGAIIKMGDKPREDIKSISTGSLSLDAALGIGGIPRGRVIEIYGPESSSKTTTSLHIAAECQKAGGVVAFIDAEHALDPKYAANIGVNVDELYLSQPSCGEECLEIAETLARSGAVDLIIIDSVAALTPKVELEGEMTDQTIGVQARLMSKALRKLTGLISKMDCSIIFINQIRQKIGVTGFGASNETTSGGNALKFYASVRIDVRRIQTLKQGETPIGIRVKAKVIKNKVASPFREGEYDVIFGEGISKIGEIIDYAVAQDIIDKAGAWFSYKDTKLGQGREKVKEWLKENPAVAEEIELQIKI